MTSIADIVDHRHIAICCGTGGVGKTTTAATLAIEGARRGRDTVVVTIDPAKRLANTLGSRDAVEQRARDPAGTVGPDGDAAPTGRLHALMLDTETTFDQLVQTYAQSEDQAATDPREPLLPQHRRRPVGHAGVHGDGEALRAARPRRLRPHRRRHPTHAARARLPRRAASADAHARQPRLPHPDGADAHHAPGRRASPRRRCSARSRVSSAPNRSTTSCRSSAPSRVWRTASATGPTR